MMRGALVLAAMLSTVVPPPAVAIELTPSTITEWNRYVGRATSHLHECRSICCDGSPDGRAIDIAGGTIHHWRGSTVVRHVTVDQVVNALMNPGTPPPQDDVLESRVLSRNGNALRIYRSSFAERLSPSSTTPSMTSSSSGTPAPWRRAAASRRKSPKRAEPTVVSCGD
jgi:hypothetical protein